MKENIILGIIPSMVKLNARELRRLQTTDYRLQQEIGSPLRSEASRKTVDGRQNDIYIILDNVLDTYNVGSIFRLAESTGAKKVYLCGTTTTPPNPRIKKASINTTEIVEWSYKETAVLAIKELKQQFANRLPTTDYRGSRKTVDRRHNIQVVAIEQSEKSVPYDIFEYKLPIALIVGNETYGVSQEVLDLCDGVVELPMYGINISLNVMVSLGIILYKVLEKLK
ncbi:MAG: TrmH family RNA methyltransferase [Candidatus Daviesbacteria bacterium]